MTRGAPTSAIVSSRSSSLCSVSTRCSWSRHRARNGTSAGQLVVSNAWRAAATAACASATDASGAWSSTWPVAGLTDGYVRSAATSFPSMSMRYIGVSFGAGGRTSLRVISEYYSFLK